MYSYDYQFTKYKHLTMPNIEIILQSVQLLNPIICTYVLPLQLYLSPHVSNRLSS